MFSPKGPRQEVHRHYNLDAIGSSIAKQPIMLSIIFIPLILTQKAFMSPSRSVPWELEVQRMFRNLGLHCAIDFTANALPEN